MRALAREQQFRVVGPEVSRDPGRVPRLVEFFLGESDRVRLDGLSGHLLHERHDRGGIDSAGQERAERNVRIQSTPDRVREERVELVDRLGIRAGKGLGQAGERDLAQRPIRLRRGERELWVRHGEDVSRRQLDGTLEDALRRRDVQVSQIGRERRAVDRAVEGGAGQQRLELRAEGDQTRLAIHVQRFLADSVSEERQLSAMSVPHGDGEHPDKAADALVDSPPLEGGEDHLGVRVPPKAVSVLLQLAAELLEVVDLSVEDHDEPARGRPHRLVTVG